jgi:MFS family permease
MRPARVAEPQSGRVVLAACLAAAVMTTGIQGIAPALPAAQQALDLTDAQVAWLTSVYLLPGVLLGVPAGILTERIGRRAMYVTMLTLYGLGGLVLLVAHSLPVLLMVRAVQGAAFGAILALTVTMIGDVLTGPRQGTAQGRRVIAMTAGEAIFPAAAGVAVGVAWYAPFALQVLALPIAVFGWLVIPELGGGVAKRSGGYIRQLSSSLHNGGIVGLQVLAFLRFFLKFALVTYYPLLAVTERDMSAFTVGLALGASAVLGTVSASIVGVLLRRMAASALVLLCLVAILGSFVVLSVFPSAVAVVIAVLIFGVFDGMYAVAHNVLITETAPAGARAAFVSLTGTVRNVGKLVAPLAFGAISLVLPLTVTFLAVAFIGAAGTLAGIPVRRLEASQSTSTEGLRRHASGDG